jgi:hypothetical protein
VGCVARRALGGGPTHAAHLCPCTTALRTSSGCSTPLLPPPNLLALTYLQQYVDPPPSLYSTPPSPHPTHRSTPTPPTPCHTLHLLWKFTALLCLLQHRSLLSKGVWATEMDTGLCRSSILPPSNTQVYQCTPSVDTHWPTRFTGGCTLSVRKHTQETVALLSSHFVTLCYTYLLGLFVPLLCLFKLPPPRPPTPQA